MPTNVYFDHDYPEEQNLYESLVIESLQIYGQETYYIPRFAIRDDEILNEEFSKFSAAYAVEMYIENTQGFEGEGTLLSKFGLEIRDQANFIVSRSRFRQLVELPDNPIREIRPQEGDLIYLPLANSLFEIKFVEHEQPFYQLRNLPTYQLQCELFEYSHESIDTGIASVDDFESRHASRTIVAIDGGTTGFAVQDKISQRIQTFRPSTAQLTAIVDPNSGFVTSVRIDEPGFGYRNEPDITFPAPFQGTAAEGTAVINSSGEVIDVTVTNAGSDYVGNVEITDITESPLDDRPEIVITGEVAEFTETRPADAENNVTRTADLALVGIEASNGSISSFNPDGENILDSEGNDTGWSITQVYDVNDLDRYIDPVQDDFADNSQYQITADDILDFSEENPFGDPRI